MGLACRIIDFRGEHSTIVGRANRVRALGGLLLFGQRTNLSIALNAQEKSVRALKLTVKPTGAIGTEDPDYCTAEAPPGTQSDNVQSFAEAKFRRRSPNQISTRVLDGCLQADMILEDMKKKGEPGIGQVPPFFSILNNT